MRLLLVASIRPAIMMITTLVVCSSSLWRGVSRYWVLHILVLFFLILIYFLLFNVLIRILIVVDLLTINILLMILINLLSTALLFVYVNLNGLRSILIYLIMGSRGVLTLKFWINFLIFSTLNI